MICPRCGAEGDPAPCGACGHDRNVGRRVGRFVAEARLGGGGMGSLYRGRCVEPVREADGRDVVEPVREADGRNVVEPVREADGRDVAIKFLKPALLHHAVLRERFRREALSLARLRHPGIVALLDFGEEENGELYTVLELVRGSTLAEVVRTEGALRPERAAVIFDQVLAALEVCHDAGIVHRDLKPSNIMLGAEDVKLIDFGLARIATGVGAETLTETGTVHGTPSYMPPEQCRGEEVGPPGDVYATGIVLYEVLAGTSPFQGADAATFMAQHLFVEPAPLRAIAPHVPAAMAAAVHRALAKREEDRPTARDLRAALAGTGPEARAEAAADERRRVHGLGRVERAVATVPREAHAGGGDVIVWMEKGTRSDALRGCLATAGFRCELWTGDEPPAAGNALVVTSARRLADGVPLRGVIVVDVAGPEETTLAIRAGAADMLLRESPDADLTPKIRRLLRRRGQGR